LSLSKKYGGVGNHNDVVGSSSIMTHNNDHQNNPNNVSVITVLQHRT